MPSYILPVERTREAFLKPPEGLRFGNFENVSHFPPPLTSGPLTQSFSSLNNQQIYKMVCEWYEAWRPWQQKVLLCGIVDRSDYTSAIINPFFFKLRNAFITNNINSVVLRNILLLNLCCFTGVFVLEF